MSKLPTEPRRAEPVAPRSRLRVALPLLVLAGASLGPGLSTTTTARAEDAGDAIVARGRIAPKTGVIVVSGPPESLSTVAIVDKLLVGEGDDVSTGQVLAIINGYDLARADLQVAKANLALARLERLQVEAGVGKTAEVAEQRNVLAARQAVLTKTEKDWQRTKRLVEGHAASVQVLDDQQAALDQATQDVAQTQNAIKALSEVRPVDDAVAAAHVAVAEASLEKAKASVERLEVRARQPGTVLSIETRAGESIGADGILRLGDLAHLVVTAEVDETQALQVKLGMKASIGGAMLATPIQGTVTLVGHEVFKQKRPSSDILVGRDARIVEVEVTPQVPLPQIVGAEVTVRFPEAATVR